MKEEKPIIIEDLFPFPAKGITNDLEAYFVERLDIEVLIENSLQSLRNGRSKGLCFVGERGAGKTSTFDYLKDVRCPKLDILPLLIDASSVKGRKYGILEQIIDSIKDIAIKRFKRYKLKKMWWGFKERVGGISLGGLFEASFKDQKEEKELIQKMRENLEKHLNEIKKNGNTDIKGILIMLDDADEIELPILGRLGNLFNNLKGYSLYLAMGSNFASQENDVNGDEAVVGVADGILGYWERVKVERMTDEEVKEMLNLRLNNYPDWQIPEKDMSLITILSNGNGRIAMSLANKSVLYGKEERNGKYLLHITQEVFQKAKEAQTSEGLRNKLERNRQILLQRDTNGLKPRWW